MEMELKPRTSCSLLKCMKIVCIIFAVMNAVICLLAFLNSLIFLICVLVVWIWNLYHGYPSTEEKTEDWDFVFQILIVVAVVSSVATATALYFAVLLCLGIQNDNKRYIKRYLAYGVTVTTLTVLGLLLVINWLRTDQQIDAAAALIVCLAYSGILFLIYKTYLRSDQEASNRLLSATYVQQSYGCQ
ncbi:uncharacterized protein LOC125226366 [Leguminivora glycinivorella]|uniref:uncharacterized protein LOC125226366 n=1 Tax=Leguminivora glycinivorella TaxID=1035111 RepID=UPI00200DF7C8|nr:uncharacterized protein LOC125226366 [Leguminivora glycinivorella]